MKVGLIGAGNVGIEHLNYYAKDKRFKKIFLFDKYKIVNKKIPKTEKNLNDRFVHSEKLDLLSIANYDSGHCDYVLKGIKKNINLFVEKPLCINFDELKKIYYFLSKNKYKKLLMSNLVLRESSVLKNVIKKIRNGEFGEIYYFEGDYLYGRLNKIIKGWRGKETKYSVILGGGIHLIDIMLNVFKKYPTKVKTSGNKIVTNFSKFKEKDFAISIYEFPNGAIGKITSNFGCVHKHQHVIKIFGTKKTFIYDDNGPRIYSNKENKFQKIKISKLYDGKDSLLKKFVKMINISNSKKIKIIMKEINLMSVAMSAQLSLDQKLIKKIKIFKKFR